MLIKSLNITKSDNQEKNKNVFFKIEDEVIVRGKIESILYPRIKSESTGDFRKLLVSIMRVSSLENETILSPSKLSRFRIPFIGNMYDDFDKGTILNFRGIPIKDPKYGKQFNFTSYDIPDTMEDTETIRSFLIKLNLDGLTEENIDSLILKFGTSLVDVLDNNETDKLKQIKSLDDKVVKNIFSSWGDQRKSFEFDNFFGSLNIDKKTMKMIYKINNNDKEKSVENFKNNPYDYVGITSSYDLRLADDIALKCNFEKNDPRRIEALITYAINDRFISNGHTCAPIDNVIGETTSLFDISYNDVSNFFECHQNSRQNKIITQIINGIKYVYTNEILFHECKASININALLNRIDEDSIESNTPRETLIKYISKIEKELNIIYNDDQINAIINGIVENVSIITGGPGTGKTTIVKGILKLIDYLHPTNKKEILLLAPTGRASKRLGEATGMYACTIHKALETYEADDGKIKFQRHAGRVLEYDYIIVDETSMVDVNLFYSLLEACDKNVKIVFVGDPFQLPSIGPGNVLRDMIASNRIPFISLINIYRQSEKSHIVTNSKMINDGIMPYINNNNSSDFFFIEQDDNDENLTIMSKLITQFIETKKKEISLEEIQVLSPMYRGTTGIDNANRVLQNILNENKEYGYAGNQMFKVNDKIIIVKNDYRNMVFNGEIGYVESFITDNKNNIKTMVVMVGEKKFEVPRYYIIENIKLAYCVSIHKSQGSEYECVILLINSSHYGMLQRTLLYTAVTRAKKFIFIIGEQSALQTAVNMTCNMDRCGFLSDRISEIVSLPENYTIITF